MMSSFKPLISGWAKLAGKVSWSFSLNHPTLATPRDNGVASGTDNALLGSSVRSPQERPDDGTFFKKISPRISRYLIKLEVRKNLIFGYLGGWDFP